MIRHFACGTALTALILCVSPAQALDNPVQQVSIEARFVEIDRKMIEDLPIGRDFRSIANLVPAVGGIANSPADLAPASLSLGVQPERASLDQVIRALETEGFAAVLGTTTAEYGSGQSGTINLANLRMDVNVPRGDGQQAASYNVGITLNLNPGIIDSGYVDLGIRLTADYVEFEDNAPAIDTRSVSTTIPIKYGQTLVIGGLFDDGSREAADRIPGLGDIPILGALFRSADFQGGRTDLAIFVTPRLIGDGSGGGGSSSPPPVKVSKIEFSGGMGYGYQGMPNFGWLRTETGFMGNIVMRPLVSENSDFDGMEWRLGAAAGLPQSLLGGKAPRLGLNLSYFNADTESFTDFVNADGNGLGIEDGTGSGLFVSNGNGDLFDVRFQASYEAFEADLMIEEDFDVLPRKGTSFGAGLNLRYSDFGANLMAVTNGNTLNIERDDSISTWIVAPTVKARVSYDYAGALADYGGSLTAYGGASFSAGVGFGDGRTMVTVGGVQQGQLDESETAFVYNAGINAGALIDFDPVVIDLKVALDYGNYNPVFNYQPVDPAKLEFKSDVGAFFGVTAKYRLR